MTPAASISHRARARRPSPSPSASAGSRPRRSFRHGAVPHRSSAGWARPSRPSASLLLVVILVLVAHPGRAALPARRRLGVDRRDRPLRDGLGDVRHGRLPHGADGHIAIKVVDFVLPVRALGVVKLLGHALIAVTCVVLVYATYDFIPNDSRPGHAPRPRSRSRSSTRSWPSASPRPPLRAAARHPRAGPRRRSRAATRWSREPRAPARRDPAAVPAARPDGVRHPGSLPRLPHRPRATRSGWPSGSWSAASTAGRCWPFRCSSWSGSWPLGPRWPTDCTTPR